MSKSDEKLQAVEIANRFLDEPYADPDSDQCIVARQFLRALERLGEYTPSVDEDA
jgi:hypothetical protein